MMRFSTKKYLIRKIIWLVPFIILFVYGIILYVTNENETQMAQENYKAKMKEVKENDTELPLLSVCSQNQFSERDAEKVFEMEEYRDMNAIFFKMVWLTNVTLNSSEAMSVLRNFAMYKMDANEIENFSDDQIDYLLHHRKTLSKVIKHQIVPSCDELMIYCNYKGQDRLCTDLFRIAPSFDGLCCILQPHKIKQIEIEPPSPCKNHSLIDDGKCDLVNFHEVCNFDGKDCCPNPSAIGNGYCNLENDILLCNNDGGDCCNHQKIMDGFCDPINLNRICDYDGDDCSCDYKNLTRDGQCNLANNKSNCLFDDFDCSCPNSLTIDDGECTSENYNYNCNFDGTDCNNSCDFNNLTKNGHCNLANNKTVCLYDNFDCLCPNSLKIDDGECDKENYNPNCYFDGMDCKYFVLINQDSGKAIDASLSNIGQIVMWSLHGNDNQMWFWDGDLLRSKMFTDKVIDFYWSGSNLIFLNDYQEDELNQKWLMIGDQIVSKGVQSQSNQSQCLEVSSVNNGATVGVTPRHGGLNQLWNRNCIENPTNTSEYFSLINHNSKKALDASNTNNGKIAMWPLHGNDNQLWFWDGHLLRNKMFSDKVVDFNWNGSNLIFLNDYQEDALNQKWSIVGNEIISMGVQFQSNQSRGLEVISVDSGSRVGVHSRHGGLNQLWRMIIGNCDVSQSNTTGTTTTIATTTTTLATTTPATETFEKDPLTILCPEYVSIGNDICDESNDKLVCYYDGGDCSSEGIFANCTSFECFENNQFDPCPKYDDIGNGQCNKENFNLICSYDSGDCQVENSTCEYHKINDGNCHIGNFIEKCNYDGSDCCPNVELIGNTFCNPENDIISCNYDGGDCCLTLKINDGFCDPENYNRMCNFDGEDCYCKYNLTGNGICDLDNNKAQCDYDGGDCCDLGKIGDGLCYRLNDNPKCHNDGGDCCEGNTLNLDNGHCDEDLNNAACLNDKGDCCEGDKSLIADGVCHEYNYNPSCQYDGGDCLECSNADLIGNGLCNEENLKYQCDFDGLDCCSNSSLVNNGECNPESYSKACKYDGSDCCLMPQLIGNGKCDLINNVDMCNFDGGDCCEPEGYGSGWCFWKNNNRMCEYDGGDCCSGNIATVGDGVCHDENNNGKCKFDGGDCCLSQVNTTSCTVCECINKEDVQPFDPCPLFSKVGDGICHDENNNNICGYDGGDCCGSNIDYSNCTDCYSCLKFKEMPKQPYQGHCPQHTLIGDGVCQDENNREICSNDGEDCCLEEVDITQCKECKCYSTDVLDPCPDGHKIGNGVCDLSNNNTICSFDGGDCSRQRIHCQSFIDLSKGIVTSPHYPFEYGNRVDCAWLLIAPIGYNVWFKIVDMEIWPYGSHSHSTMTFNSSSVSQCPGYGIIGNGLCDSENNNAICNYDGGDCCPNSDLIMNDVCDYENYNHACFYDGGDCCFEYEGTIREAQSIYLNGDGQCSYFHNIEMCNFDGGDCCNSSRIADGICDDINNNILCQYDGGDCCFGNKTSERCYYCRCIETYDVIQKESFDYLTVYDGNDIQIRGLTGNLTNNQPVLIKGSEQTMLVRFKSDSVLSGRGFKATLDFKPQGLGTWTFCSTSNLCQIGEGNCGHDLSFNPWRQYSADYECSGGLRCGYNNCPSNLELSNWTDCCYQSNWRRCQDSLDLKTGVLFSPHYPNFYEPFYECSWLIPAPENHTIMLEFTEILLGYYTSIKIYDGNSTRSDLLGHVHDNWRTLYNDLRKVRSSGTEMLVTFSTDHEWVNKGFFAKIYHVPDKEKDPISTFCTVTNPCRANEGNCYHDQQCFKGLKCGNRNCPIALGYANDTNCCYEHCNEWLDLDDGILTSPNYPDIYPAHTECAWLLSAPQGQFVTLIFHDFNMDGGNEADYVRIFDGNNYGKTHLLSQLTGSNIPSNVSSLSSKMLVIFDSDYLHWHLTGFKATFITEKLQNNTNNTTNVCTVSNPCDINEGHCYYDGQCHGSLRCGDHNCPQESGYNNGMNCCYDYCGQFLDVANGILDFHEPHGETYKDMEECTWNLAVDGNHTITIEFYDDFFIDNHWIYDYLRVYDDNSPTDRKMISEVSGWFYSSSTCVFPSNISSSSNELLIVFKSDEWYRQSGFKAKIHSVAIDNENLSSDDCSIANPCEANQGHCQSDDECKGYLKCGHDNCLEGFGYPSKTRCCYDYCSQWLDMENGILTSPWYPDYYPRTFKCNTLITVGMTVAGPRTITLEFLQFKLQEGLAFLKCRDGNSSDSSYLSINSGYVLPPNVTSSGNQMMVSFVSKWYRYPGYFALVHENPHYCEQWLNWEERTIRSPTFPDKKTKSRNCLWLLTADKGYTITINVEYFQVVRKSEGVSYFDGPTNSSAILREDTDYLLPFTQNISSSGNQMLIRYFSEIEIARVYGVLLRFYCKPTASTMSSMAASDEDCFTQDNTIHKTYRSWRVQGLGDRYFKKSKSRDDLNGLPLADKLKKLKPKPNLKPEEIMPDSLSKRESHLINHESSEHCEKFLRIESFNQYMKNQWTTSNQFDDVLNKTESFTPCIKPRNNTQALHPILALFNEKKKVAEKRSRGSSIVKQKPFSIKDTELTMRYPRNVVKMAMKTPTKKYPIYVNIAKGHENQEMIFPRPDLTIMVQPSKIDHAGRKNNGGVRLFIHRPQTVPTNPFKEIKVDNNVEAFINLKYQDVSEISNEFIPNKRCIRYITRSHLWHNYSIEIANDQTYTWDSCVHEWQAKTMMRICKCLPHYYSELFDYWYNTNLRCNHQGLKCMAIVNGTSYMYNSTWGNSFKPIHLFCPALCGQREYDATLISQSSLKNDSWYIRWLQTEGNRLYDLENQLTRYYFQGSPHDYALIEDHKQKLMNDSSVLHFYFDNLQFEKKRAFEPPSTPSFPDPLIHFWLGVFVAAMMSFIHKLYMRFILYKMWNCISDIERAHEKLVIAIPILAILFYIIWIIKEWAFVFVQRYNFRSYHGALGGWAF